MAHKVRIIATDLVTHDVKRIIVEKPKGYTFEPGQATEVSINKPGLEDQKRPFTFTSLPKDEHLELIVKMYEREGVTQAFNELDTNDELLIGDAWGSIKYQGSGYFIAGGAGLTPFLAIFRDLEDKGELNGNTLLYSNKFEKDIIQEIELEEMIGLKMVNTLTREKKEKYLHGRIDEAFLKQYVEDFSKKFYVCSTMEMTNDVIKILKSLGVNEGQIIYE
jgi:ferredoxin-NADP reductase